MNAPALTALLPLRRWIGTLSHARIRPEVAATPPARGATASKPCAALCLHCDSEGLCELGRLFLPVAGGAERDITASGAPRA